MIIYPLIVLISIALAVVLYYRSQPAISIRQRALLAFLRAAAITILLFLLILPILYFTRQHSITPVIIALHDVSHSMSLKTRGRAKSDILTPLAEEVVNAFAGAGYQIAPYDFAQGLEEDKSQSLLAPALTEAVKLQKEQPLHAIVLKSDGWLRDEDLTVIKRSQLPLYVIADSSRVIPKDLIVHSAKSAYQAYRNEPNLFKAEVSSQGVDSEANVSLIINGKKVAQKKLSLSADSMQSIEFVHRFSQTGFFNYSISIEAPSVQERSLSNNSFPGALEVLAEKERIIVISDKPGWDNKFMIDALGTNPRWETIHYTIKDNVIYKGNAVVPKLELSNLAAFIVINNGNLRLNVNLKSELIRLHNSGIGFLYQGLPIPELAEILPLKRSNITASYQGFLKWTAEADAYPMLEVPVSAKSKIPPLEYYYTLPSSGASTVVSIDNPQNSVGIAVKKGIPAPSIGFSFLNLWRWQMQAGDESYRNLIVNSLLWLANRGGESLLPIYNPSYFLGESPIVRLRFQDDIRQTKTGINPKIQVFDSKNELVYEDFMTLEAEEFFTSIPINQAGNYRFEISEPESGRKSGGRFAIAQSSREERDFDYNSQLLAWLAYESGGKIVHSLSDVPIPKPYKEERIENIEVALYKKWYIISLFILLFCLELFLRRRWGLL